MKSALLPLGKSVIAQLFFIRVVLATVIESHSLTIPIPLHAENVAWHPTVASAVSTIGKEAAIRNHLKDEDEFEITLGKLFSIGKTLFDANWTDQEGGGRPLTKGTGRPISNGSAPLTGNRSFNRVSAPDANSCMGCHNSPYGISGGGGDFVTNVFVLG